MTKRELVETIKGMPDDGVVRLGIAYCDLDSNQIMEAPLQLVEKFFDKEGQCIIKLDGWKVL